MFDCNRLCLESCFFLVQYQLYNAIIRKIWLNCLKIYYFEVKIASSWGGDLLACRPIRKGVGTQRHKAGASRMLRESARGAII